MSTASAVRARGPAKDRARKRAVILEAAEAEFADAGYQGASMQAIADRAGVPKANVHYYFGSKEQLYRQVLEDILGLWNDFLSDVTPADDPALVLEGFVRQKLHLAFERPRASRLFAQEILRGAPVLAVPACALTALSSGALHPPLGPGTHRDLGLSRLPSHP